MNPMMNIVIYGTQWCRIVQQEYTILKMPDTIRILNQSNPFYLVFKHLLIKQLIFQNHINYWERQQRWMIVNIK